MSYLSYINENAHKYFHERPTAISELIELNATKTAIKAIPIPAGAYVTKVQVFVKDLCASQDMDVGTGRDADYFVDGLATLSTYAIITAPFPITASARASQRVNNLPPHAGAYFATATWINVTCVATETGGSVRIFAWYYV